MKLRYAELLVPVAVACFGLVYWLSVQGLPRESTVFPITVLIALAVLAVAVLLSESRRAAQSVYAPAARTFAPGELTRPLMVFVGAVGYLVLFAYAGFIVAALVFMIGLMIMLGTRPLTASLVSAAIVSGLYLLFAKLFYVDL